jgi:hypothetical protein
VAGAATTNDDLESADQFHPQHCILWGSDAARAQSIADIRRHDEIIHPRRGARQRYIWTGAPGADVE